MKKEFVLEYDDLNKTIMGYLYVAFDKKYGDIPLLDELKIIGVVEDE